MISDAVILFGGQGTRMRPYTLFMPKCLFPFKRATIMDEMLSLVMDHQVDNIYLTINERHSTYIERQLRLKYLDNLINNFIPEEEPTGTAGWMKYSRKFKDTFLVCNGDDLQKVNLKEAYDYHKKQGAMATIIIHEKDDVRDSGHIKWHAYHDGKFGPIDVFSEKPKSDKPIKGYVSTGWYILEPIVFDMVRKKVNPYVMFERDVFPEIQYLGRLYAYKNEDQWFPTGNMAEVMKAEKEWRKTK